jgi:hypothetical protein
LVALSVVVMPFLSWTRRRAGGELGSAGAVADSQQTPVIKDTCCTPRGLEDQEPAEPGGRFSRQVPTASVR